MKRILALLALMTAASFVHAQQDAKFYYDRSNSYYNKKEYDKAIADFSEALWLNTNHANAYRNLYASRHTMYGGGG
jgi:tetratricopeptide (TPR) repeat protein